VGLVQVGEESLDLLTLGAALPQRSARRQGVAPGHGLVGAERAGKDHGPRSLLLHGARRYGVRRPRRIVKIE
jgi:hypothetical protein